MSVIALASARGAPGVTTAALAVSGWIDDGVLLEADTAGGVLAIRYGLGREPGLLTLAASGSSRETDITRHAQLLPGGTAVVPAPETAAQALHVWDVGRRSIEQAVFSADRTVVVDLGRLAPGAPTAGIAEAADVLCVVARPVPEQLIPAAAIAKAWRNGGIVLIGDSPYSPADVAAQLDVRVHGVLADDARAAGALATGGGGRNLARSALMRSARALTEGICGGAQSITVPSEVSA